MGGVDGSPWLVLMVHRGWSSLTRKLIAASRGRVCSLPFVCFLAPTLPGHIVEQLAGAPWASGPLAEAVGATKSLLPPWCTFEAEASSQLAASLKSLLSNVDFKVQLHRELIWGFTSVPWRCSAGSLKSASKLLDVGTKVSIPDRRALRSRSAVAATGLVRCSWR